MSNVDYHRQQRRREMELQPPELKIKTHSQNLRIRTEPDCDENADAISRRISQIKNKYNIKERAHVAPLGEINHEQISNISGLNIKEVDSPMNCLNKTGSNTKFFGRIAAQGESPSTNTLTRQSTEAREISQLSSTTNLVHNDPRIQNIDKINMKIRSILSNFDVLEGRLMGYNSTSNQSSATPPTNQKDSTPASEVPTRTELKKHREQHSTSYTSTKPSYAIRGKFDINKHTYKDLLGEERQNVRGGKTESYAAQRASFDAEYWTRLDKTSEPKELPQENIPYRIRRLSDFEETNQRNYQTTAVPRVESAFENNRTKDPVKETNKSIISVFPKRERVHIEQPIRQIEKTECKRLFETLKKQVQLDEEYRNKKYVFKQMKAENKLFGLMAELSDMGVRVERSEQLANEMKISEEEFNPFYTCRGEGSYKDIATAYIEAKKHWECEVLGRFDHYKLTEYGFTEQAVDLNKKGYLTVEDLVRLLNLEADTFVRNRDLVLVHRRLATNELTFPYLIRQLCG